MPALPYWLYPGDDRPSQEIDDEIAEELRLHVNLLAEEHERRGIPAGEAQRRAAEQFGDFGAIVRRCRREKQGDSVMVKRVQALLIGLLVVATSAMGWSQWQFAHDMVGQQLEMRDQLASIEAGLRSLVTPSETIRSTDGRAAADDDDAIRIRVVDDSGSPIDEASLTFGWTNAERNYFDSFVVRVDEAGEHQTKLTFRDKQLDNVTAIAPGHAFVTESLNRPFRPGETLTLQLPRAVVQRLKLLADIDDAGDPFEPLAGTDGGGDKLRPLTGATVRLNSRYSQPGESGSAQYLRLQTTADEEGIVSFDCLAVGDAISLTAIEQNQTWYANGIDTDPTNDPLVVRVHRQQGTFGGGGGAF